MGQAGVAAAAPLAILLAGGAMAAVLVQGPWARELRVARGRLPLLPLVAPRRTCRTDALWAGPATWDRYITRDGDAAGTASTGEEDGGSDGEQRKDQRRG